MNDWQPIDTAPKDGTIILAWYAGGGCEIVRWNGRSWDDGDFYDDVGPLTHWMPLPEPPND